MGVKSTLFKFTLFPTYFHLPSAGKKHTNYNNFLIPSAVGKSSTDIPFHLLIIFKLPQVKMARLTIRSHPRHRPLGSSRLPQKLPSRPAALEDSSRTGDPETMDIELRNGDPAALQPACKVKNSASAAGVFMKKRKEQRLARKQRKLRTPTTESTSGNLAANVTGNVFFSSLLRRC